MARHSHGMQTFLPVVQVSTGTAMLHGRTSTLKQPRSFSGARPPVVSMQLLLCMRC